MNKQFKEREIQMAGTHISDFSHLLVVREIQIKVTLKCHIPIKLTKVVKASISYSCWRI